MQAKKTKLEEIATITFQDGKNSPNTKNLNNGLKVWFKILPGCVHQIPSTNHFDYINTDQKKYMLYYISFGTKMNLPSVIFKYLKEMVNETRNGVPKPRNWIRL